MENVPLGQEEVINCKKYRRFRSQEVNANDSIHGNYPLYFFPFLSPSSIIHLFGTPLSTKASVINFCWLPCTSTSCRPNLGDTPSLGWIEALPAHRLRMSSAKDSMSTLKSSRPVTCVTVLRPPRDFTVMVIGCKAPFL